MARGDAEFQFKRFKWNKKGYNAFKSSAAVSGMLQSAAERIKERAGEGYRTDVEQSSRFNRPYAVVATNTDEAAVDNAANNTLLKSIDAGRLQ